MTAAPDDTGISSPVRSLTFGLLLFAGLAGWVTSMTLPKSEASHPALPEEHEDSGYLGSDACQSCHPGEHASWKKTYHRSMTRRAADLEWNGTAAPSFPAELELYDRDFLLRAEGEKVLAQGPDLHWIGDRMPAVARSKGTSANWKRQRAEQLFREAPQVKRELVMVTGSHHYLAFWLEGGANQELRQFPFVFLLEEKKWVPRKDAFLQPQEALPHLARWNSNCIQCHAVAGRPGQSEGRDEEGQFWESYNTDVAELGIGCEACHGPGRKHADHYRDPFNRHQAESPDEAPPPGGVHLLNPKKIDEHGGRNPCGGCHSYFMPTDADEWWEAGFSRSFQPGDALSDSRTILTPENLQEHPSFAGSLESLFWKDGSMIVGGREYNGMIASPCYQSGAQEKAFACTSCHTMHGGDPDGQIDSQWQDSGGDQMCTQCHDSVNESHSRHAPGTAASRCTTCHMPRTSYALLQGLSSHRIVSPQPGQESPPNACVLCHVDRSQESLDSALEDFSEGKSKLSFSNSEGESWAAQMALSGNAAQRAIFAYSLGTEGTQSASDVALAAQLLGELKNDDYAAIRLIAERSLNKLPDAKKGKSAPLSREVVERLLASQNKTPIVISE